jgi:hypothetical protein
MDRGLSSMAGFMLRHGDDINGNRHLRSSSLAGHIANILGRRGIIRSVDDGAYVIG